MKKRVLFIFLFLLVVSTFFVAAQTNDTQTKAYTCLQNLVNSRGCSSLSTEEKIFSLLSIGACQSQLSSDSSNNECWPSSSCTIKTTAQAILALNSVNADTTTAQNYLLGQAMPFTGINWFLQVETVNSTNCTATYEGTPYSFNVNPDNSLSQSAGPCLSLINNPYWFTVDPSCYNYNFSISCGDTFLTSLLYQQTGSQTIYVSQTTHSASGSGTTTETVDSQCFGINGLCDYEGTLWAALALKATNHDVSSFIPYLISMASENALYIPDSFLYSLTNEFETDLLSQQNTGGWWSQSGDNFYDTAVALLPFQNSELPNKATAESWLSSVQGTDGCWQDNIRNTAFILYSLWPRQNQLTVSSPSSSDCATSGFYCLSSAACTAAAGNVLSNYTGCFGTDICCSKAQPIPTCAQQSGAICPSGQQCLGGTMVQSSDSNSSCCITGVCGVPQTPECVSKGNGLCKTSCASNEQISSFSCPSSEYCCVVVQTSYLWLIIVLVILIGLVALGIIYRKKLNELWLKYKPKFGKGKPPAKAGPGPRFPPSSQAVYPGAVQRRILPSQPQQRAPVKPQPSPIKSEFDDVLNKLKEIGK